MTNARRVVLAGVVALTILLPASRPVRGYSSLGYTWANGSIVMHLQLGPGRVLSDGSPSWNQSAIQALATWNNYIDLAKFAAASDSTIAQGDGDLVNNVFFSNTVHGRSFGNNALAVTTAWIRGGTRRVEADVVFNTDEHWDSYRGRLRSDAWDIQRVALHEFGHALGLSHPDENGQNVAAVMNSHVSDVDRLTADDINGGRALYGAGVTSNVSFPPRNETNDFNSQLEVLYRDRLQAPTSATYVDGEGANVWLTEYARYRVGLCAHAEAATRVFAQIDNAGVYGVCALTPPGAIPFPPRNEGLDFMIELDAKYRDGLRRGVSMVYVNNEGRVVWILEYLRYRLNGCGHGDATTRVFQQILGQGIQPVCSS